MPFRPEILTWTSLLAKWMDFARSSVALPDDQEGRAWRESVVSIIELQAVTFALGELIDLPEEEQALALDKAELLIDRAQNRLHTIWSRSGQGESAPHYPGTPPQVTELVNDARNAHSIAKQRIIGREP